MKVFEGDSRRKDIEIIGQKGNYSIWTDPSKKNLVGLREMTGSLSEVKKAVASYLCTAPADPKKGESSPSKRKATKATGKLK